MSKNFNKSIVSLFLLLLFSCHSKPVARLENASLYRGTKIDSIRAKAEVKIQNLERTFTIQSNVLMDDQSFFIQAEGFGIPSAYASLHHGKLITLVVSQHEAYVGNQNSSLKNLLGVDIMPRQIMDLILLKTAGDDRTEFGPPIPKLSVKYPQNIRSKRGNDTIMINFSDVEINPTINPKAFQIDIPPSGFQIYSLE